MSNQRDYILGRNVSEQARAQESRGTIVVSFRVSDDEFDALSDLANSQGKTVSQVAREACKHWRASSTEETQWGAVSFVTGHMVSWGSWNRGSFGTGEPDVKLGRGSEILMEA